MSRIEVRTREVFLLNELPESVQCAAHAAWSIDEPVGDWWDASYDDFESICKIVGVTLDRRTVRLRGGGVRSDPNINFSGFWSQGDGAMYCGNYAYVPDSSTKIRNYCNDEKLYAIVDALREIQRPYNFKITASIDSHGGNYCHSHMMRFEFAHPKKVIRAETQDELAKTLRSLADWLYRGLEAEYEYLTSFEAFKESCEANEYEFTAEGKMI